MKGMPGVLTTILSDGFCDRDVSSSTQPVQWTGVIQAGVSYRNRSFKHITKIAKRMDIVGAEENVRFG